MIIKNNKTVDPYQKMAMENVDSNKKNSAINNNAGANLAPKNDTVSLSEEAQLRAQASVNAMNAPDVRKEKVSALKEQVSNGTYAPNSMRTAKAMVSDMLTDKALYSA